ncbi:MAG: DUF302 domain-containing protein [Betaproteobacteria bacterium]|nr:DUF302 domain-containing protein [Betaproteobacteria bacterium]
MRRAVLAVFAACALAKPAHASGEPLPGVVRYAKQAAFEDVREDLSIAIQNRGLAPDLTSRIHDMLQRTGKDLGDAAPLFGNAVAYSFCSAAVSRAIMAADPHNVVFCPFTVIAYAPLNEPGKVYVAYRRPPAAADAKSNAALRKLEALLDGIAREAVGMP